MADIIEEAGLSAGSIYSHFESKSEIIRLVASEVLRGNEAMLSTTADNGPRALAPGDLVMRIFSGFATRERARVLIQMWAEVVQDQSLDPFIKDFLTNAREVLTPSLEAWLRESFDIPEDNLPEALRKTFDLTIAATHGCMVRLAVDSTIDPDTYTREVAEGLNRIRFD